MDYRWTGKPGVLQSMGSQRVRHDRVTDWTELNWWTVALPGSSGGGVSGISRAKIPEVASSFSKGSSQPRDQTHMSCIAAGLFTTEQPEKPQEYCTNVNFLLIYYSHTECPYGEPEEGF